MGKKSGDERDKADDFAPEKVNFYLLDEAIEKYNSNSRELPRKRVIITLIIVFILIVRLKLQL